MEAPASRVAQCLLASPGNARPMPQRPKTVPTPGTRRQGGAIHCVMAPDKDSSPQRRMKLDWSSFGTTEETEGVPILEGAKASRMRHKLTQEEANQGVRAEREAEWGMEVDGQSVQNSGALSAGVQWYSIWTAKGYEEQVAELLQDEMAKLPPLPTKDGKLKPRFYTVWAPKKRIMVTTARRTAARTVRYGMENTGEWVLLECIMDNHVFELVNSIPLVRGFRHRHPQAGWIPLPCSDELISSVQDWLWDTEDKAESRKQPVLMDAEEEDDEDVASVPLDVLEDVEQAFGHGGTNIDTWEKPRSKSQRGRGSRGRRKTGRGNGRAGGSRPWHRVEDSRGRHDEGRREATTWYEGPAEPASPWSQWQEDLKEPSKTLASQEQQEGNTDDSWVGPALSDPGSPSSQWFENEPSSTEGEALGWMENALQPEGDAQGESLPMEASAVEALDSALVGLEQDLAEPGSDTLHTTNTPQNQGENDDGSPAAQKEAYALSDADWSGGDDWALYGKTPQNQGENDDGSPAAQKEAYALSDADWSGGDDWALYGNWASEATATEEDPEPMQTIVDNERMDSPGTKDASIVSSEEAAKRGGSDGGGPKKKRGRPRKSSGKPSETSFRAGDNVLVVSGTFEEFKGVVVNVNWKMVDVSLDIFGRTTTVAVDKQCLKKIPGSNHTRG